MPAIRPPTSRPLNVIESGDLTGTCTLASIFDPTQDARIVQEAILEPVVLRLEPDAAPAG